MAALDKAAKKEIKTHQKIARLLNKKPAWVKEQVGAGPFSWDEVQRHVAELAAKRGQIYDEEKRTVKLPDGVTFVYTLHEVSARTNIPVSALKYFHKQENLWKSIIHKMPTCILLDKEKHDLVAAALRSGKR